MVLFLRRERDDPEYPKRITFSASGCRNSRLPSLELAKCGQNDQRKINLTKKRNHSLIEGVKSIGWSRQQPKCDAAHAEILHWRLFARLDRLERNMGNANNMQASRRKAMLGKSWSYVDVTTTGGWCDTLHTACQNRLAHGDSEDGEALC